MSDYRRFPCEGRARMAPSTGAADWIPREYHVLPERTVTVHVYDGQDLWEVEVRHWQEPVNVVYETIHVVAACMGDVTSTD